MICTLFLNYCSLLCSMSEGFSVWGGGWRTFYGVFFKLSAFDELRQDFVLHLQSIMPIMNAYAEIETCVEVKLTSI